MSPNSRSETASTGSGLLQSSSTMNSAMWPVISGRGSSSRTLGRVLISALARQHRRRRLGETNAVYPSRRRATLEAMASPALKKIGIVALVLVVGLGVAIGWMWYRITALPSWYEQGDMVTEDGQLRVDQQWV